MGIKVGTFDPIGMERTKAGLPMISYCEEAYSYVLDADAIVTITEWVQFRAPDRDRLMTETVQPVIVDLRNVYGAEEANAVGFVERASHARPIG